MLENRFPKMQRIARLPEEVINQIAAGEVVESPASIVKEMIENSLDAKASRIAIWIEGGGERLVRIEDDGCGMDREDALLSLERHATSKIRTEQDLQHLSTMGFRGEALAAIAAVSCLEMNTSNGHQGTLVKSEGGRILGVEPCARNRGTTISVRSLFFNVPARKKFMKSASANTAQVVRTVETIALAHPEIAFFLQSDKKTLIDVEPEERKKRIEQFIGSMPHQVNAAGISGSLGSAEEAKLHRRGQYLFVNSRPIFSPLISRAVKMGYGTRIAEHAYPSFVLFLSIPSDEVDVNVHPQKREVRFSNEGKIFREVELAVASAFCLTPSFQEPLFFTPPSSSFSLAEEPSCVPHAAEPLSFDFPLIEKPLAIVDHLFLLQSEELLLIDLAAARANILSEDLQKKTGEIQTLIWPLEVIIEDEAMIEELQAMGIECRLIGKRMVAIDALPSLLDPSDFADFLQSWRVGKRIDLAANRYARASKKHFTLEEGLFLWKRLQKCRSPQYDVEGKKIWEKIDAGRLKSILT
jgi:DNA mismatch repair protein MutL